MEGDLEARRAGGHKAVTRQAYDYLLGLNDGYALVDGDCKRAILKRIAAGDLGKQAQRGTIAPSAFDLVRLPGLPARERSLAAGTVEALPEDRFQTVQIIEVKGTRGPRAESLNGLFFSFQFPEQQAAQSLGPHYTVVFVVINVPPERSFHKSMSWSEMWAKAKSVHIQFSIRL